MKTITVTKAYYKAVEVEVEVPNNLSEDELKDFIEQSEQLSSKIDNELADSSLIGGEIDYNYLEN